jgi:hypothetical protein
MNQRVVRVWLLAATWLTLAGCGQQSGSPNSVESPNSTPGTGAVTTVASGQAMSDPSGEQITVESAVVAGQGANAPEILPNGWQCFDVRIRMTNNGSLFAWLFPLSGITLVDASGKAYQQEVVGRYCPYGLQVQSISPGQSANPDMYFAAPRSGNLYFNWATSSGKIFRSLLNVS